MFTFNRRAKKFTFAESRLHMSIFREHMSMWWNRQYIHMWWQYMQICQYLQQTIHPHVIPKQTLHYMQMCAKHETKTFCWLVISAVEEATNRTKELGAWCSTILHKNKNNDCATECWHKKLNTNNDSEKLILVTWHVNDCRKCSHVTLDIKRFALKSTTLIPQIYIVSPTITFHSLIGERMQHSFVKITPTSVGAKSARKTSCKRGWSYKTRWIQNHPQHNNTQRPNAHVWLEAENPTDSNCHLMKHTSSKPKSTCITATVARGRTHVPHVQSKLQKSVVVVNQLQS